MIIISEKLSALIVGGSPGERDVFMRSVEVFSDQENCQIPNIEIIPIYVSFYPTLINNNDEIRLCGRGEDSILHECYALQNGTCYNDNYDYDYENGEEQDSTYSCLEWRDRGELNNRVGDKGTRVITMPNGVYLFGPDFLEWLPTGQATWKRLKPNYASQFEGGCLVQTSAHEILMLGGLGTFRDIVKYDTQTHKYETMPQKLQQGRYRHSCIKFEDTIIITGGENHNGHDLSSTELLNIQDLTSITEPYMDMEETRVGHGLVIVHYNNEPKVLAIGGEYKFYGDYIGDITRKTRDTVEIWDPASKTWTLDQDLKLSESRANFGFVSVPTHLLCSP